MIINSKKNIIHSGKEIYYVSIPYDDEYFREYRMNNKSYLRINGVWYITFTLKEWPEVPTGELESSLLESRFISIERNDKLEKLL